MFRNDGYISAYNVREIFDFESHDEDTQRQIMDKLKQNFSLERHLIQSNPWDCKKFEVTLSKASEFVSDREISSGSKSRFCSAAFSRFLSEQELFLSGPSEKVIPVDQTILQLHYFAAGDETTTLFEADTDKLGVATNTNDAEVPWSFIEGEYLSVRCREKVSALAAARAKTKSPNFRSYDAIERKRLRNAAALEPIARLLLPFEGMVLALQESDIPDQKEIREFLNLEPLKKGSLGRPNKGLAAAETYRVLFPNGHEGNTHKEVLRAIEQNSGITVTWNTLLAGCKQLWKLGLWPPNQPFPFRR